MLTFVGVVFTITLVALQLASAQLSPRVIRTFVRSGITKLAFGLFLATFAYAIVVYRCGGCVVSRICAPPGCHARGSVCAGEPGRLRRLCDGHDALLQVSWVVTAVAEETRRVLARERPCRRKLSVGRGTATWIRTHDSYG